MNERYTDCQSTWNGHAAELVDKLLAVLARDGEIAISTEDDDIIVQICIWQRRNVLPWFGQGAKAD